jgi:glutathione synthase/RimK-type ligase-like ATP-grasp enzyme
VIDRVAPSVALDDALFETALTFALYDDADVLRAFLENAMPQLLAPTALLCRLADAASLHTRFGVAVDLLQRAILAEPDNVELHFALAIALEESGDLDAARAAWNGERLRGLQRRYPYTGTAQPIRVLTIASALHAIRFELFVDPAQLQNTVIYTQNYDPGRPLPEHDIALCAVADVESDALALSTAQHIAARSPAPVINHPDRVLRTGRVAQAARLDRLEGVVTARVVPMTRNALQRADAVARLAAAGIGFPLLIRATGFHNGRYFAAIDRPGDLAAAAAAMPHDDVLVQSFMETRSADGLFRKFRVMMIGGRLYPVHLAISRRWKVHYVSSAMGAEPAFRDEEAAFLRDMNGFLGAAAFRALEAIAAATDLDYGGIDFGLTPDGAVAVFEANGAMAIFVPDADARWDYRRAAMTGALTAATDLLCSRALRH